jgi:hypothetical protein
MLNQVQCTMSTFRRSPVLEGEHHAPAAQESRRSFPMGIDVQNVLGEHVILRSWRRNLLKDRLHLLFGVLQSLTIFTIRSTEALLLAVSLRTPAISGRILPQLSTPTKPRITKCQPATFTITNSANRFCFAKPTVSNTDR